MVRCLKKSTFTIQLVPSHSLRCCFTTNEAHLLYNKVNNYKCMEVTFRSGDIQSMKYLEWNNSCSVFARKVLLLPEVL